MKKECIVCKKELEGAFYGKKEFEVGEPPSGAVIFRSKGNYGSEVFDEKESQLEIFVCDDCLVKSTRIIRSDNS